MSTLVVSPKPRTCPRHGDPSTRPLACRWCAELHMARELAKLAKCAALGASEVA